MNVLQLYVSGPCGYKINSLVIVSALKTLFQQNKTQGHEQNIPYSSTKFNNDNELRKSKRGPIYCPLWKLSTAYFSICLVVLNSSQ